MPDAKQPPPAVLAFTRIMICVAGLLCCVFLIVALVTGEAIMPAKSGAPSYYWNNNPGYFLAALGFYSAVIGAAVYVAISWMRSRIWRPFHRGD